MYLERQPSTSSPVRPDPEPERPPERSRLSHQTVMALQRSAGNAAVGRLLAREPAPAAAPPAAGSGIDWSDVWQELLFFEDGVPTSTSFRQVGELGRVLPVFGLATGAAADAITIYEDLSASWQYDAPNTHALLAMRGAVNLVNNAIGHLIYFSQLGQDAILTVSPASAGSLTALTAGINETLAWFKVTFDMGQAAIDTTVITTAMWNAIESAPPAPGDEEAFNTWMQLAANYEANLIGDTVGVFVDGLDILTAGLSHSNTIEDIAEVLGDVFAGSRKVFDLIVMELQGQLNMRGGELVQIGLDEMVEQGPGLALDAAIFTLGQMQGAHQVGDDLIGQAAGVIGDFAARAEEVGTVLLGGRDPFTFARTQAVTLADELGTRIATLGQLAQGGTDAAATTAAILAGVEQTRAMIEFFELPDDLELDGPELGDGMAASVGETLLDVGADLAGRGAATLLNQALDVAKQTALEALDALAESADELGRFMALLAEQAQRQAVALEAMLVRFEESLARTENFEELFEALIESALAATGIEADIDFDDLRGAWDDAGRWITEMLADLEARRAGEPPPGTLDETAIRTAPRMAGGQADES